MFTKAIDRVTSALGSSVAVGFAFGLVLAWLFAGLVKFGFGDSFQLVLNSPTTAITFCMTFVILSSQNRSDKAMHAKLDGIIAVLDTDNRLEGIESMSEKEIDEMHNAIVGRKK